MRLMTKTSKNGKVMAVYAGWSPLHSSTPRESTHYHCSTASWRNGRRKRPRSGSTSSNESKRQTEMSPLAKRLKLSEGRRGKSSLKTELLNAGRGHSENQDGASSSSSSDDEDPSIGLQTRADLEAEDEEADMGDASDDEDNDDDADDDDFLAKDFHAAGSC